MTNVVACSLARRQFNALCVAILAGGFELDDVAALWLCAELEVGVDSVCATLTNTHALQAAQEVSADGDRWWRDWLRAVDSDGGGAMTWPTTLVQTVLQGTEALAEANAVAASLQVGSAMTLGALSVVTARRLCRRIATRCLPSSPTMAAPCAQRNE